MPFNLGSPFINPAIVGPALAGSRAQYQDSLALQLADLNQREGASRRSAQLAEAEMILRDRLARAELAQQQSQFVPSLALDLYRVGEQGRLADEDLAFRQSQLSEQSRQFGQELGLRTDAQRIGDAQFAAELGLRQDQMVNQFNLSQQQLQAQLAQAAMEQEYRRQQLAWQQENAAQESAYREGYLSLQQQQERRLADQFSQTSALGWDQSSRDWTRLLGESATGFETYADLARATPPGMQLGQVSVSQSGRWTGQYRPVESGATVNPLDMASGLGLQLSGLRYGADGPSYSFEAPGSNQQQMFAVLDAQRKYLSDQLTNYRILIGQHPDPEDPTRRVYEAKLAQVQQQYDEVGGQLGQLSQSLLTGNRAVDRAVQQMAPWTPLSADLSLGARWDQLPPAGPTIGQVNGSRYSIQELPPEGTYGRDAQYVPLD